MDLDLAVVGGSVVDDRTVRRLNVGIRDGSVACLTTEPLTARTTIDASGCYVLPGAIDAHVHLQPTLATDAGAVEDADTIIGWIDDYAGGSKSAACGGVTTLVDFAMQKQGNDTSVVSVIEHYRAAGESASAVDFCVHAGLSQPTPETIAEIPAVFDLGVTSFKFFRTYRRWGILADLGFIHEAFGEIARLGGTSAVHCEQDEILSYLRARYIAEGREADLRYHGWSRPSVAEEIAIDEIAALLRVQNASGYVVHLNSRLGLQAVRRAKASGTRLQAEGGLHFLFFTEEVFARPDGALFFMTPPFRTQDDVDALWEGLADGSIDWVATDHSPHLRSEKQADPRFAPSREGLEFAIPPGFTGSEEMLPLLYTAGVLPGRISLPRLVELLCTGPARALGLERKGALAPGMDGDVVVYDPEPTSRITIDRLHTNADYTIYEGLEQRGRVRDTVLRGTPIVRDGVFVGELGAGRFIKRRPT